MDEIVQRRPGGSASSSDHDHDYEYKWTESGKRGEYSQLLLDCRHLLKGIMDDDHVQSVQLTPKSLKGAASTTDVHDDDDDGVVDVESFRDLMESVRSKLKNEEIQYQLLSDVFVG